MKKNSNILAKLDNGLDESHTVMVGEDNTHKNRGILKPSWAFVETYRISCGARARQKSNEPGRTNTFC